MTQLRKGAISTTSKYGTEGEMAVKMTEYISVERHWAERRRKVLRPKTRLHYYNLEI